MRLATILFITFLSLSTFSCQKEAGPVDTNLVGTWQWHESSGGFAGIHSTPASTGTSSAVTFDKKGTVIFYSNGQQTCKGTYSVAMGEQQPTGYRHLDKIDYEKCNSGRSQLYAVTGDTLLLMEDGMSEGFTHIYYRAASAD